MKLFTFAGKISVMRKVHLISVTEPLLYDLALAIHRKGYEVSVSGVGLTQQTLIDLENEGCLCHGDGWYPETLKKDIEFVVLGATVRQDNPELIRAKEMGLLVLSIPEFIFQRTKSKTRVVVAGSRGNRLKGQIARIGIIGFAGLRNQNAIGAGGAVPPEREAFAHAGGLAVARQANFARGRVEPHRQAAAA